MVNPNKVLISELFPDHTHFLLEAMTKKKLFYSTIWNVVHVFRNVLRSNRYEARNR